MDVKACGWGPPAICGLTLFLVGIPPFWGVDKPQPTGVFCRSPFYYVGTTKQEPSFHVEHRFPLANRSGVPLRIISVEAACGCSKASRRAYDIRYDPELPDGSDAKVGIGYWTAPAPGFPDIREFSVRFEPSRFRRLNLTVLAQRLESLTVFPGRDILMLRDLGGVAAKTLYLVSPDRNDLRVEPATPLDPGLSIRQAVVHESPDLHLPAAVWKNGTVLKLEIEVGPPVKTLTTQIRLGTNQPEAPEVYLNLSIF